MVCVPCVHSTRDTRCPVCETMLSVCTIITIYADLLLSSNSSRQLKDKKLRARNGEQLEISTVIYRNNKIMLEDLHSRKTKITFFPFYSVSRFFFNLLARAASVAMSVIDTQPGARSLL